MPEILPCTFQQGLKGQKYGQPFSKLLRYIFDSVLKEKDKEIVCHTLDRHVAGFFLEGFHMVSLFTWDKSLLGLDSWGLGQLGLDGWRTSQECLGAKPGRLGTRTGRLEN